MAEYSSLKVPELKKLLAEKGLPQTGNKADLIARLQENDKEAETEEKPGEFSLTQLARASRIRRFVLTPHPSGPGGRNRL